MSRAVENTKYILACVAVFLLVGFCTDQVSNAGPAHDPIDSPQNIKQQTAVLYSPTGRQLCSGTFIGDGKIVTAAHCTLQSDTLKFKDINGEVKWTATVTKHGDIPAQAPDEDARQANEVTDWAILEVEEDFYTPPETAFLGCAYRPEIGDSLAVAGYPGILKGQFIHTVTRVNAVEAGGDKFISVTGMVKGGMSGGGFYEDGRLVGIVSHGGQQMQFAASINEVCQALE